MGGGRAPAAQETSVLERPLAPSPQRDISGTTGTARTRGTGRPLEHPATGGPGLPRGTAVAWSIRHGAVGSRGVPTVWNRAWDPGMAGKLSATSNPGVKTKLTAAWDLREVPDDHLARHPGPKTFRMGGNPFGQSRAKPGSMFCQALWSPWSWAPHQKRWTNKWTWIHLHQSRPGTAAACRCSLPSESTTSGAGVPAQLPTPCSGSIPSSSLEPPNNTE